MMTPEKVIGILKYDGKLPDMKELRRKALEKRAERVLAKLNVK